MYHPRHKRDVRRTVKSKLLCILIFKILKYCGEKQPNFQNNWDEDQKNILSLNSNIQLTPESWNYRAGDA